jgi:hypothetical protein
MSWSLAIPKIEDGKTTFSAADINPILQALEDRTDFLKQNIVNNDILDGVGFTDIGFEGCHKGQFIAYSWELNKYVPANALWDKETSLPSSESYVLGVLISEVVDGRATLLVSGILRGKEIVTTIIGHTANKPGHYYLSADGKVTDNVNDVTIPIHCGTLTATNCFVLGIQIPDFQTHTHTSYDLKTTAWSSVSSASSDITKPENALLYYNSELDPSINNILRSYIAGITLVVDNKILKEYIDYEISDGYIWLLKDFGSNPQATLYATNPCVGIIPWLTGMMAAEGNQLLKISQAGSTAIVDMDFNVLNKDNPVNNGHAITNISRQGIVECDIVNSIKAGAGIDIVSDAQKHGTYIISATNGLQDIIDFNILNGNGIVLGGDDVVLIKFPAQRNSSVVGTARVPSGIKTAKAQLFMYVEGTGSSVSSARVSLKSLNIPNGQSVAIKPTTPKQLTFPAISTPNTDSIYMWKSQETFNVSAGDQLNITVSFNNPSITVSVCSIGIMLQYT